MVCITAAEARRLNLSVVPMSPAHFADYSEEAIQERDPLYRQPSSHPMVDTELFNSSGAALAAVRKLRGQV